MSTEEERLMSGEAWHDFCDRLKATGDAIIGEGFPTSPFDRAEGYRWLTRLIGYATQMEVEAGNAAHPFFIKYELPHNQWGGPNPDNVYFRANVSPEYEYRIWANVNGMREAIFSLNEGDMQLGEYGVYGEHMLSDFEVGDDGSLEIFVGHEARPGNFMPMHESARLFTIRVYQSDWAKDSAPPFHIERVGAEGVSRPPVDAAFVAKALDRSAHWVEKTAVYWNMYTERGWQHSKPNVAGKPGAAKGGADNILYGSCFWQLGEDEALVIECERPDAEYVGFTQHTMAWLESADFADRQTSLSGHQLHYDSDDRIRVVVAQRDPGVPNWIDIGGRERGMLVYRWVGARNNPVPTSQVVSLAEVRDFVPEGHPRVDEAARRASIRRRREEAWNRFL